MLKTLNSVSSWPNAAPVSALLASSTVSADALAFAHDQGLQDAEQLVAIGGEVLQDVDGTTLVAEDGDQVDSGQLRAQEFLRGRERAQLVGRAHGSHVEVQREQPAILIAIVLHGFRRNLGAGKSLVDFDLFRARRGGGHGRSRWSGDPGARRSG